MCYFSIKYYEYKYFNNVQEIDSGGFAKVHRAKWKATDKYFALKIFYNFEKISVKGIVNEVNTRRNNLISIKYFLIFFEFRLKFTVKLKRKRLSLNPDPLGLEKILLGKNRFPKERR